MAEELFDLDLDEISLVDDPASPGAQIVLAKRNSGESRDQPLNKGEHTMSDDEKKRLKALMDKGMSEDEAMAQMKKEAQKMSDTEKRARDAEAQIDVLAKQVAALTEAVEATGSVVKVADGEVSISKRSEDDYVEVGGERVLKSSIPAPVLKQIEAQAKDLADLKKAAEIEKLDKRAGAEIPNFGGDAGQKRALLKAVDRIEDEETRKGVAQMLNSASRLMAKSFTEIGATGAEEVAGSAMAELNKMAADYADKHGVTFEAGFAHVTQKTAEGRKLFAKRNEQ